MAAGLERQYKERGDQVRAAFLWAFPVSLVIFLLIKYTIGLRASEHEEAVGLDVSEHGMHAYPPSMVVDDNQAAPVASAPMSTSA